jgi:hypothetical protein
MKKNSKVSQAIGKQKAGGNDRVRDYTNATQQTRFELPFFAVDDKGAHTVKNAITRVIFAPDSIRQQNLPKGVIRRGATQVKYLVPCAEVEGRVESILDKWMSPLWYKANLDVEILTEILTACMKQKMQMDITGSVMAFDLAPFICVAFAIKTFADKEDFSYSFTVQAPCDRFHEDRDLVRLDAEIRSRLAAVAFFKVNPADLFIEKDLNKADRIIVGTFTNGFFTIPSTWDRFSSIGDAVGGRFVHTIGEYRSVILSPERFARPEEMEEEEEVTTELSDDHVTEEEVDSGSAESTQEVPVEAEGVNEN